MPRRIGRIPGTFHPSLTQRPVASTAPATDDGTRGGPTVGGGRIPALDGIRGLGALLVVAFHLGRPETNGSPATSVVAFFTQFGWVGVDLFFVLSGFLIGGILLDSRERPGYFRSFYTRRALRIFPLSFAFIALYVLLIVPHLPGPPSDIGARQPWLWTYLANFDIARNGWYSGTGSNANALWSLAIEEQFYLVIPLAVLLLSRRGVVALAIACAAGSVLTRALLAHLGFDWRVGYVATPAHLDGLSIGLLLAVLARRADTFDRLVSPARLILPLALVAAAVLALARGEFDYDDWIVLQLGIPLLTLAFAAALVLAVSPNGSTAVRRIFESRALRFYGLYSYSLYIWHPFVGRMLRQMGFTQRLVDDALHSSVAALVLTLAVKIVAATGVAIVSYHLIEQPFLRLKDLSRARGVSPARVA